MRDDPAAREERCAPAWLRVRTRGETDCPLTSSTPPRRRPRLLPSRNWPKPSTFPFTVKGKRTGK